MFQSDIRDIPKSAGAAPPLVTFGIVAGGLTAAVAVASAMFLNSIMLPVFAMLFVAAVAGRGLITAYPHTELGLCNIVTTVRAAMVAFLAGAVFDPQMPAWTVFLFAGAAFSLDGLDGWLARQSGLVSGFGARFDMETDAALAAVLALGLLAGGVTGPEVLILGFTRYVFILAGMVVPALRGSLRESLRRKSVCVVQIAALLFLLCPAAPEALLAPVSVTAAALLVWSFTIDTLKLLRGIS